MRQRHAPTTEVTTETEFPVRTRGVSGVNLSLSVIRCCPVPDAFPMQVCIILQIAGHELFPRPCPCQTQ